ncbi:MAG: hypothetical protein K6G00_11435, partial [Treponema sp.]|nr:hypothetical protein [Treponema sp.]
MNNEMTDAEKQSLKRVVRYLALRKRTFNRMFKCFSTIVVIKYRKLYFHLSVVGAIAAVMMLDLHLPIKMMAGIAVHVILLHVFHFVTIVSLAASNKKYGHILRMYINNLTLETLVYDYVYLFENSFSPLLCLATRPGEFRDAAVLMQAILACDKGSARRVTTSLLLESALIQNRRVMDMVESGQQIDYSGILRGRNCKGQMKKSARRLLKNRSYRSLCKYIEGTVS